MRKHLIIKGLIVCLLMLTLFSGTVFAQDGLLSAVDSKNPEQAQSKAVQESLDGSTRESKEFPEKYDLRNLNGKSYVTSVKNQGSFGTCWAHGTISTIETNLLLKGADPNTDLSEKALVWYTHHYQGSKSDPESQYEGTFTVGNEESCYDAGAFFNATAAQLASWNAACTEKEVPYTNSDGGTGKDGDWTLPYDKIHEEAYHVQNAHIILNRANVNDDVDSTVATLKQAMLDYGTLYAQYFISRWNPEVNPETNAQNSPIAYPSDHAVSIVGWDDNFPKSNFYVEPPGDGAWIVKNSWGSGWLDNGYVYLSYYDPTLDKVAIIDAESKDQDGGYTYDHNYQYDYLNNRDDRNLTIGAVNKANEKNYRSGGDYKSANVFESNGEEVLKAVGLTIPNLTIVPEATIQVYLLKDGYVNPEVGELVDTVNYKDFTGGGFYTIELNQPVNLHKGTKFSVVCSTYTLLSKDFPDIKQPLVPIEFGLKDPILEDTMYEPLSRTVQYKATVHPGESFVYGFNGQSWEDPPEWADITDPEIQEKLTSTFSYDTPTGSMETECVPGNVMLKAFTSDVDSADEDVLMEGLTLNKTSQTIKIGKSYTLKATVTPNNVTDKTIKWTSSDSSVAQVDDNGKVTAKKIGKATITAEAQDGSGQSALCEVTVTTARPINRITLNKTRYSIKAGKSYNLKATITPNNATDKTIKWTSSDLSVAKVDKNGKVTAKKVGATTVLAQAQDGSGKTATCEITVTTARPINKITLNKTRYSLQAGYSYELKATVTPSNATDKTLLWTSDDPTIASVNKNGKVTARKVGTTTISAMAQDGSGKTATCTIIVKARPINRITLNKTNYSMKAVIRINSKPQLLQAKRPIRSSNGPAATLP